MGAVIDTSKALGLICALAYLINIVDSTLVYTLVIYHVGSLDKCISRIYNDIINYWCYTKCQHACIGVYAIVTVARAVQSLVVIGIHSALIIS